LLLKISISNKCCSFEHSINQRILKKSWFKNQAAQQLSKLIIRRHFSRAANQHIIMISEGSWDTEDWSNDAERHKIQFNINLNRKQLLEIVIIFHNITAFLLYFLIKVN